MSWRSKRPVTLLADLTLRQSADDKAAMPSLDIVGYTGAVVKHWGERLVIDLSGITYEQELPILMDHDPAVLLGQTSKVAVVDGELRLAGKLTTRSGPAAVLLEHAANGFRWRASLGLMTQRVERVDAGASATVNGSVHEGPLRVVRAAELREISIVSVPADRRTTAAVAMAGDQDMTLNEWIESLGFSADELTDVQLAALKKRYEAETAPPPATEPEPAPKKKRTAAAAGSLDPIGVELAAARAERQRIEAIAELTRRGLESDPGSHEQITMMAESARADKSMTPEQFELLMRRTVHFGAVPILRGSGDHTVTSEMVECALCLGAKMRDVERAFPAPVLERTSQWRRGGMSLCEMLAFAASRNGHRIDGYRDVQALLRGAFDRVQLAGGSNSSTLDVPGIFSNVANKFLHQGFRGVEQTWRAIAETKPVRDYKAMSGFSINVHGEYEPLPPSGELRHANLTQNAYGNQAALYGFQLQIGEQHLINDDLGALSEAPMRMGQAMSRGFNRLFWSKWLDDSAFFTSGNGNYFAGAETALGVDSLKVAIGKFMRQTFPKAATESSTDPLGIMPRILLTGPELMATALQLTRSALLGGTGDTDRDFGTFNPFGPGGAALLAVSSQYITSDVNWYLLADPGELAAIQVAFLNGVDIPIVETAQPDFGQLGVRMRVKHSFGIALQEPRAAQKQLGESE